MAPIFRITGLFFFLLLGMQPLLFAQNNALKTFLQSPSLRYASVGIKIVDLQTKKTHCAHNEKIGLVPASTMKVVTTATALELLGENHLFKTVVFTDGTVDARGQLNGNIYIQGSGDPTLGTEYLEKDKNAFLADWLKALQKNGIKKINGSVIVLDNLYGYEGVSVKWSWEDLGNYYASGTYGISIFDNTYRLYLNSGAVGSRPTILRTEPVINLSFENRLKAAKNAMDSAYIYGIPFSNERRLYGTIPHNRTSFVIKGDIPDPGLFLASYFTSYLKEKGISTEGKPSTFRLKEVYPTSTKEIAVTLSSSMKDIVRVTNVRSNNHFAEHLFYACGNKSNLKSTYMPGKSAGTVKNHWSKKGTDCKGIVIRDGSGLSPANTISAEFLTDILAYMYDKSKSSETFRQSLPLAGKEGTVRSLLKGTTLEGKARIKSGSIAGVQSYAGYIEKNGKTYAFSLIINNFTGNRATLRSQIEKFLLQF